MRRQEAFKNELLELLGRYQDVQAGARAQALVIGVHALATCEKGAAITEAEFLQLCRVMFGNVDRALAGGVKS